MQVPVALLSAAIANINRTDLRSHSSPAIALNSLREILVALTRDRHGLQLTGAQAACGQACESPRGFTCLPKRCSTPRAHPLTKARAAGPHGEERVRPAVILVWVRLATLLQLPYWAR